MYFYFVTAADRLDFGMFRLYYYVLVLFFSQDVFVLGSFCSSVVCAKRIKLLGNNKLRWESNNSELLLSL